MKRQVLPPIEPLQLRREEAARFLAISPRLLDGFVHNGDLLPVRIPGIRRVVYRVAELRALADKWAAMRKVAHE